MDDGSARRIRSGDLGWLLAIGGVALTLRLAYSSEFASHPLGRLPWVDEGAYYTRAQAILNGSWLPERPFYQDPLYPYLLAALMRIVGIEVARLRVALACLGTLTPIAIYWAGRIGLGRAEGVIAGFFCAVYGPLIYTDGLLEKEGLGALVAAMALALMAWATRPGVRVWTAALGGLAWGLVGLLRANALVIAPMGTLWWLFAAGQSENRNRRRAQAGLFLIGFVAAIAPVTIINAYLSRPTELIVTTWQAGSNFYIGNSPEATGTYVAPAFVEANPTREADDFAAEASRRAGRSLSPAGVSRFWLNAGLRHWGNAPFVMFRLLAYKVGLVVHDFEIPDNQDIEFVRLVAAPRLSWGFLSFGVLLPLAALGLGAAERRPFWSFLVLSTAAGLLTTAVFFVVGRYRIPWVPGLALLAAVGVVDTIRPVARREWKGVALRVVLLAIPALLVAWRPMADPTPDRWGHAEIELALANLAVGKLEPAIDALDDARALGGGTADRVATLLAEGLVHDRLAALVMLRLSLGADVAELDRARWFRQLPETRAEGRRRLEELLQSRGDDPAIRRELGAWWLGEPDSPDAREQARAALMQACRYKDADVSASVLLALLGSDPDLLIGLTLRPGDRSLERVRLAREILSSRKRLAIAPRRERDHKGRP
jgi:4-amino-4-deoxy-L-arabinose transferase-like glycosyltransferase